MRTKKRWRSLLIRIVVWGGVAIIALVVLSGRLQFACPSRSEMPLRGIDVSHHQGLIDWAMVAAAGIDFAYLKSTEGGDWVDPRFAENWEAARAAGIPRGAYHFFTFCRPATDQARNFINTVPRDADALPPAVDLEFVGNCSRRPSRDELLEELRIFLSSVEEHSGRRAVLYATNDVIETYLRGELGTNPVWARDLFGSPELPDGRSWLIWQYHNRGRIAGIDGPVDLNAFRGSRTEFDAWRRRER